MAESFRPPGDVGVHAGAADFLADFIDDQDVDMGQLQARHLSFCQGLQGCVSFEKFIRRDDFQGRDVVAGALDHADGKDDVYLV